MKSLVRLYKSAFSGLPREAWLLASVVFVNRVGTMVLLFITLYLTKEMSCSLTAAGRVVSVWGVGSLLSSYFGGWLSDRWGAYKVQIWSLLLGGLGYIILGFVRSYYGIMATIFIVGIISDAFRPANCTAMAKVCPPELRARGFALNRLAVNVGIAVGPAIGGFLATINYGYLFWVDGLTCLGAGLLLVFIVRRLSLKKPGPDTAAPVKGPSPWHDGVFMLVMGLLLVVGIVFFQLFNSWSVFVKDYYHLNEDGIGLLIAVNAALIVLVEMPLVHKLEKRNTLQLMALGSILITGGFSLIMFGRTFGYAAGTVVLWTMGEILLFPVVGAYTANRAPDAARGQYIGIFTLTFSLAMVVAPVFGAWLYESKGPFVLWTVLGVAGVLVFSGFQILDVLKGRRVVKKNKTLESV